MSIELSNEQHRELQAGKGKPIDVVDPATSTRYVLLAREQYEKVRSLLEPKEPTMPEVFGGVPLGILRSQQAFWRELPELLKNERNRGKTVCYRHDEQIGIADRDEPLIRECLRRG